MRVGWRRRRSKMFFLLVGKDEGERGNGLERVEGARLL